MNEFTKEELELLISVCDERLELSGLLDNVNPLIDLAIKLASLAEDICLDIVCPICEKYHG